MQQQILPPENASPTPDSATKLGIPDHTGAGDAGGRVLHVNLGFFKYGTDDKAQAAAMILSVLILVVLLLLVCVAPVTEQVTKLTGFLESAFLLAVGVAIGQSISGKSKSD